MGLFSIFKKTTDSKQPRKVLAKVIGIEQLTDLGKKISFDIPNEYKELFNFVPGQYINVFPVINGEKFSRSYSICSGKDEPLSIGVKAVEKGIVSNYLVYEIKLGDELEIDFPKGNFKLEDSMNSIVCFAAGSGITPFFSFVKSLKPNQNMKLFYGNSYVRSTFFHKELSGIENPKTTFLFSREHIEGANSGRLDKNTVSEILKSDLSLLNADAFFICGPEAMILEIQELLLIFGVSKAFIHVELFTAPTESKGNVNETISSDFSGTAKVSAILDGEVFRADVTSEGKSVLESLIDAGADAPYSCKGGVCCTCRAKIIEGSARMDVNYSLSDDEVKAGYILTCQAHPTSDVLKIDYDV
jgi:ring-1,2-phenylacetyl-CoA epoxidase subunit PaaE